MVQLAQLSKLLIGVVIIATLFFFAGRCTAPGESTVHEKKIDSLNKAVLTAQILQLVHKQKSEVAMGMVTIESQQKELYRKKYERALAQMLNIKKDSAVKSFAGLPSDSSRLTDSLASAIVVEQAQLVYCTNLRKVDSVEMAELTDSYLQLDSAYTKANEVANDKTQIIAEQKKIIRAVKRKPHWWEYPLIGIALIIGIIVAK